MAAVSSLRAPAPADVEYFLDARGEGRSLRVRRHDEEGLVVLSVWRGNLCTATFRLDVDDVDALVAALGRASEI